MYIIRMLLNAQGSQSNSILTNPKTCRTPKEMPNNTLLSIHQMIKYEDEDAEYAARTDFYRPPTKQLIKQPFAMHI